jgi:addiction module RelE/StbE family toxin
MKAIYWTPEAFQDRDAIYDSVAAENPMAALTLDQLFQTKTAPLSSHPAIGRAGRVQGTRELVVHRNYILVYDILEDAVRILRVLHARRQWPPRN